MQPTNLHAGRSALQDLNNHMNRTCANDMHKYIPTSPFRTAVRHEKIALVYTGQRLSLLLLWLTEVVCDLKTR
jgi:hypothetical protein